MSCGPGMQATLVKTEFLRRDHPNTISNSYPLLRHLEITENTINKVSFLCLFFLCAISKSSASVVVVVVQILTLHMHMVAASDVLHVCTCMLFD